MAPFIITPGGGGSGDQVLIQSDSNTTNAKMTARIYPGSHLELKYGYEGEAEGDLTKWIDLPLPAAPAWLIFLLGFLSLFLGMAAPAVAQNATNGLYTIFPAGIESPNYQGDADALIADDTDQPNYDQGDSSLDGHFTGINDVLGSLGVITYDTPQKTLYAGQDRILDPTGTANGPGGPISMVVTAAQDVVIDKIILDDWHRNQAYEGEAIFRIYAADFDFDAVTGPSGTLLYGFTNSVADQVLWLAKTIHPEYDLEPDFALLTDQKFYIWMNFEDVVAPGWDEAGDPLFAYKSEALDTNPYLNLQYGVTNYAAGTPAGNLTAQKWDAIWIRANPEDPTETITQLKQSTSLRIDVDDDGGLSMERLSQPLLSTTDFGSQSIQIINGGTWGGQAIGDITTDPSAYGVDFVFTAVSAHTVLGFQLGLNSDFRGRQFFYGIQSLDRSITYASGTYDDAGATGDGYVSLMFDTPVDVGIADEYVLFVATADIDDWNWLVSTGGTASYTDGILTWDGYRLRNGIEPPLATLPQLTVLLEGGDMENTRVIESGNGVEFTTVAGVTTISADVDGPWADTVWNDVQLTPGAFEFAGITDPNLVNYQPGGSGPVFKAYEFAKGDEAFGTIQLPHSYAPGTDLRCHVHWTPGARGVTEGTATVGWKMDISAAPINGVFPAGTSYDLSDAGTSIDDAHLMTPNMTVDGTGITESSVLWIRIYRTDTGADDTWAGTGTGNLPLLVSVDLHHEIDKVGEDTLP